MTALVDADGIALNYTPESLRADKDYASWLEWCKEVEQTDGLDFLRTYPANTADLMVEAPEWAILAFAVKIQAIKDYTS